MPEVFFSGLEVSGSGEAESAETVEFWLDVEGVGDVGKFGLVVKGEHGFHRRKKWW